MLGCLKSNLFRLRKTKVAIVFFILSIVIAIGAAAFMLYLTKDDISNHYFSMSSDDIKYTSIYYHYMGMSFAFHINAVLTAIFTIIFTTGGGRKATIRNKITSGIGRGSMFVADYLTAIITYAIYSVISFVIISGAFLANKYSINWFEADRIAQVIWNEAGKLYMIEDFLLFNLGLLFILIPIALLISGISFNNFIAVIITVISIGVASMTVFNIVDERLLTYSEIRVNQFEDFNPEDYPDCVEWSWNAEEDAKFYPTVPNPDYPKGIELTMLRTVAKYNPYVFGNINAEEYMDRQEDKYGVMDLSYHPDRTDLIVCAVIWSALFTAAGAIVYKKVEFR